MKSLLLNLNSGTSLKVQWSGLSTFTAEGLGSVSDLGSKYLQAEAPPPKPTKIILIAISRNML